MQKGRLQRERKDRLKNVKREERKKISDEGRRVASLAWKDALKMKEEGKQPMLRGKFKQPKQKRGKDP